MKSTFNSRQQSDLPIKLTKAIVTKSPRSTINQFGPPAASLVWEHTYNGPVRWLKSLSTAYEAYPDEAVELCAAGRLRARFTAEFEPVEERIILCSAYFSNQKMPERLSDAVRLKNARYNSASCRKKVPERRSGALRMREH